MKNLSREEMKNIFGGVTAAPNCKSGSRCIVRTLNEFGELTGEQSGNCQFTATGSTVTCYCDAGGTTNTNAGGLSHCWG